MTTFRSAGLPCPGAGSICRLGGAGGVSGVEEGFSRGEEGGGRRASTPPWWRGSPGTAAAQPVGSIESTGRETSPSRQVCSIPPAQLSLGSSDVKKTLPPSRACSPPYLFPTHVVKSLSRLTAAMQRSQKDCGLYLPLSTFIR